MQKANTILKIFADCKNAAAKNAILKSADGKLRTGKRFLREEQFIKLKTALLSA